MATKPPRQTKSTTKEVKVDLVEHKAVLNHHMDTAASEAPAVDDFEPQPTHGYRRLTPEECRLTAQESGLATDWPDGMTRILGALMLSPLKVPTTRKIAHWAGVSERLVLFARHDPRFQEAMARASCGVFTMGAISSAKSTLKSASKGDSSAQKMIHQVNGVLTPDGPQIQVNTIQVNATAAQHEVDMQEHFRSLMSADTYKMLSLDGEVTEVSEADG